MSEGVQLVVDGLVGSPFEDDVVDGESERRVWETRAREAKARVVEERV